ncbi:MAG: hypothetical protein ACUVR8_10220 [Acidobacteriota bacterium]
MMCQRLWVARCLVGFWMVVSLLGNIASSETHSAEQLSLDQPVNLYAWKYRPGDEPSWANPDLDDQDWKEVALTTTAEQRAGPG